MGILYFFKSFTQSASWAQNIFANLPSAV